MASNKPVIHGRDHLPGGSDPIDFKAINLSTFTGDLQSLIIALGPDAFWKFNETSGVTALDSSGNNHNLGYSGTFTLGNTAGPPGDLTAHVTSHGSATGTNAEFPGYTANFSAGVWFNFDAGATQTQDIMGQGTPIHAAPSNGWGIYGDPATQKIELWLANATTQASIGSDSTAFFDGTGHAVAGWHFVVITKDASTWRMYIDGALQSTTSTYTITNSTSNVVWVGDDHYTGSGFYLGGNISYGFLFSGVLTAAQVLAMYNSASIGPNAADGQVVTANGLGGTVLRKLVGTGGATFTVTSNEIDLSVSGATITEAQISLSDVTTDDVTYVRHGFAPKTPNDVTKYLQGAGTALWAQVKDSDLSLSDITTNNASTLHHGFVAKLNGNTAYFFDGTGAWSVPAGSGGAGGGGVTLDVQDFTVAGTSTWTKPANAKMVLVMCLGAGGGGGGGGASVSTARNGGGGGGGGAASVAWFDAADLGATETVTVGTGGTHGNGASAGANADGAAGSNGSNSSFGAHVQAGAGGGGAASSNLVNVAGGGGGGTYDKANGTTAGQPTGAASTTAGTFGVGGQGAAAGTSIANCDGVNAEYGGASGGGAAGGAAAGKGGGSLFGGAGGGGGGGVTAGNVGNNGGDGGKSGQYAFGGGGAKGTGGSAPTGGTGGAAATGKSPPFAGTGAGGGGGGSAGHAGQAGAKGGTGCGGGGGGCGSNSSSSANAGGNGGDGGDGRVLVITMS